MNIVKHLAKILLCVFLFCSNSGLQAATDWSSWSSPADTLASDPYGNLFLIKSDTAGNAVAVWVQNTSPKELRAATFNNVTKIWTNTNTAYTAPPGNTIQSIDLAVDPAGNAVVIFWETSPNVVKAFTLAFGSATWSSTNTGIAGAAYSSVTVDASGNALAAFLNTGTNFLIAITLPVNTFVWSAPTTIWSGGGINSPRIAGDAAGNAIVMWQDGLGVIGLNGVKYDVGLGTWSNAPVSSSLSASFNNFSIDMGSTAGNAIATWQQNFIVHGATLADTVSGTLWIATTDLGNGYLPDVALDPSGNAVAAYLTPANNFVGATLALGGGPNWTATGNLGPARGINPAVSVDVDGSGIASASWNGSNEKIMAAKLPFGSTTWSTAVAMTPAVTTNLFYTSMVVNDNGDAINSWRRDDVPPSLFQASYGIPVLPVITSVSPGAGVVGGGTAVAIVGTDFTGATSVKFGTTNAASFIVNSDTSISAVSPAQGIEPASVHITVTSPLGTSLQTSADLFTFGSPVVTAVSPGAGVVGGGTAVTVTGTGLGGATAVNFGASVVAITSANINTSGTVITVNSPAHAAGTVDVTVTNAVGTSATSSADLFTFGSPVVTAISPGAGVVGGGTAVTVTGTSLGGATAVNFGASVVAITSANINASGTVITVNSPAHAAGSVDVTVTNAVGTSATSSADLFTFGSPVVTAVSPGAGVVGGGTAVTVTGTGLGGATAVNFGASVVAITSANINATGTVITVNSPAHAAGTVDVTVTNAVGTSATSSADLFTFGAPVVTAVSPGAGVVGGGTVVTVTGTSLGGATAVNFGASVVAITSANINATGTVITVNSPAHAAGTVDVTVTNAVGTSATSSADLFTFGLPVVNAVSPAAGTTAGGTAVTVTGTGFGGATAVNFGASVVAITSATINSLGTVITVNAPAHAAGTVDVTVTNAVGTSLTNPPSDQYTYEGQPTITGLSPSSGSVVGGTPVTITGTGFLSANAVDFGGFAGTGISIISATQLTVNTPAHAFGPVSVTVTNANSTSGPNPPFDQYTYNNTPAVTNVSPNTGVTLGGTVVTLTGAGYSVATAVAFGGIPGTINTITNDSLMTVTSPPNPVAGTVDITVTNPVGTSAIVPADQFIYTFPIAAVTNVSPNSGTTVGGTTVVITGIYFTGATSVLFGTLPAASFNLDSDTQITAVSSLQSAGTVDVHVTATYGTSPANPPFDLYTFVSPPVSPAAVATTKDATGQTILNIIQVVDAAQQEVVNVGIMGVTQGTYADTLKTFIINAQTPFTNTVTITPSWCQ